LNLWEQFDAPVRKWIGDSDFPEEIRPAVSRWPRR
jgi:hypothetical protein